MLDHEVLVTRTRKLVRTSRELVRESKNIQRLERKRLRTTMQMIFDSQFLIQKTDRAIAGYGTTRPRSL
jgi:hypothetical protein